MIIPTRRSGLTLLEVMLSIAILGTSLAIIGQLVRIGIVHALNARLVSEANILCDAKMAELSAGVLELKSYGQTTIQDNPKWNFSVGVQPSDEIGLFLVTLVISQNDTEDPLSISVNRFMPDPEYDPTAIEEFE